MTATIDSFLASFGEALVAAGMPRMAARVFGALLCAHDGSATAGELAEQLKASPAAISGAVAYLTRVGMITRRRELGARRDRYSVGDDLWYEAFMRRDVLMKQWVDTMQEGIDAVGRDTPAGQRLFDTREFFAFIAEELPLLMGRWRERSARPPMSPR